jgi:hypothetical protein
MLNVRLSPGAALARGAMLVKPVTAVTAIASNVFFMHSPLLFVSGFAQTPTSTHYGPGRETGSWVERVFF